MKRISISCKNLPELNQKEEASEPNNPLPAYLDGMGAATARIMINRRLNAKLLQEYGVEDLKNIGRYYSAKIIAQNGSLIDEVLIDKQCGAITSLRKKLE